MYVLESAGNCFDSLILAYLIEQNLTKIQLNTNCSNTSCSIEFINRTKQKHLFCCELGYQANQTKLNAIGLKQILFFLQSIS